MRKTIFAFATTALALWWVFGPIVASARYSKSNEAKLDAAAKRLDVDDEYIRLCYNWEE